MNKYIFKHYILSFSISFTILFAPAPGRYQQQVLIKPEPPPTPNSKRRSFPMAKPEQMEAEREPPSRFPLPQEREPSISPEDLLNDLEIDPQREPVFGLPEEVIPPSLSPEEREKPSLSPEEREEPSLSPEERKSPPSIIF